MIFIAELLAISTWLDTSSLLGRRGLAALVGDWGPWSVRLAIASVLAFLILGESTPAAGGWSDPDAEARDYAIDWRLLIGHAAAMAALVALSSMVFGGSAQGARSDIEVLAWIATGLSAIGLAACALIPMRIWIAKLRGARDLLIFAPVAGLAACLLASLASHLWKPLSRGTFSFAAILLRPFLQHVVSDSGALTLGSEKFSVSIAPACSGYEGIGLVLAVTCAWLWFLRREWRFPNALVLIPAGVSAIWILNAVRIAALILIGNAGAERVALGGFHSQAGWIAFSLVSLGICAGARRIAWFHKAAAAAPALDSAENPVTAYLMPFLAILAAGLATRAMSSDFEWMYGIRVIAAAGALWYFRKSYRDLDFSFGPVALGLGAAVCAMWIGLDRFASIAPAAAPAAFAQASLSARSAWITVRLIGAVITVPIAEELAFRGFLLRRLVDADFESVFVRNRSFPRSFPWMPFVVSSLAFGILHGDRWLAGAIAGMVYAFAMFRRGRLGDAVAAHAFTNLLLAAWVLVTGNWQFW